MSRAEPPAHVYVAARDFEVARETIREVLLHGHLVTYDWTALPTGVRDWRVAEAMRQAVLESDALVLAGWDDDMLGALIEVGIAIGGGIPVVLYAPRGGAEPRSSLFWHLEQVSMASDLDELFEAIDGCVPRPGGRA